MSPLATIFSRHLPKSDRADLCWQASSRLTADAWPHGDNSKAHERGSSIAAQQRRSHLLKGVEGRFVTLSALHRGSPMALMVRWVVEEYARRARRPQKTTPRLRCTCALELGRLLSYP